MMQFDQVLLPKKIFAQTNNKSAYFKKLNDSQIKAIAETITIQIKTAKDKPLGTGVIICKEDFSDVLTINEKPRYLYSVLTAHHVIKKRKKNGDNIIIITPDKIKRSINLDSATQIATNDLALFYFVSANQYSQATLGNSNNLEKVYSAGFPCEKDVCKDQLELTSGMVAPQEILEGHESFQEGLKIGHDSNLYSGMSGGPILDVRGNIVGINNRKKYPTLIFSNNKFLYSDDSKPSKLVEKIVSFFAWGVPIEEYIKFKEREKFLDIGNKNEESERNFKQNFQEKFYNFYQYKQNWFLFLFLLLFFFYIFIRNKTKFNNHKSRKKNTQLLLVAQSSRPDKNNVDLQNEIKLAEIEIFKVNNEVSNISWVFLDGQKNYIQPLIKNKDGFFLNRKVIFEGQYISEEIKRKYQIIVDNSVLKKQSFQIQLLKGNEFAQTFLVESNIPVNRIKNTDKIKLYKDIWHIYIIYNAVLILSTPDPIKIELKFI